MSNFPADGFSPDANTALEPWHFTGAECSLVIYYSFPVREAETELQEKSLLPALSCQQSGICAQTFALGCVTLGRFICCALCFVILSQKKELLTASDIKMSGIMQVKALGTGLNDC
jgi:hypothetical protein